MRSRSIAVRIGSTGVAIATTETFYAGTLASTRTAAGRSIDLSFEGVASLHEHVKPRANFCVVESDSYRRKQRLRTYRRAWMPESRSIHS
jgi:hypothetical protein